MARLTAAVDALREEVRVLRDVIDEIRDDLTWACNNADTFRCRAPRHVVHITSMPKDPCDPDFGKRVNQYTPENTPEAFGLPPREPEKESGSGQRELF